MKVWPVMLPLALVFPAVSQVPANLRVEVDPRVELIAIAARLADFHEYHLGCIADYNAAVDTHFGAFKEHKAIQMLKELRQKDGVSFNALPELAIRIKGLPHLEPTSALDTAHGLDWRWKPGAAEAFLEVLSDFARVSKAEAFFKAQAPFYEKVKVACQDGLVSHLDLDWYRKNFGGTSQDSMLVCVSPTLGPCNYGITLPKSTGGEDRYVLIGTPKAEAGQIPRFSDEELPTLVHEFLHCYVNPWTTRHLVDLKAAGETLNAPVIGLMQKQGYGDETTALYESLVRAFTLRYLQNHGQEAQAEKESSDFHERGFYWVKDLATVLEEYASHRDRYATLEAFSPRLVKAYHDLAAQADKLSASLVEKQRKDLEAAYTMGPKLVAMEPADGAQDVDPAIMTLRLVFDHPMTSSYSIRKVSGGEYPQGTGPGRWDADGKAVTFPVQYKPGIHYRFELNREECCLDFRDQNGNPLRPKVVSFTTR